MNMNVCLSRKQFLGAYKNLASSRENPFCHMRITKVQISLRIRAVWSAPLLFAAYIV